MGSRYCPIAARRTGSPSIEPKKRGGVRQIPGDAPAWAVVSGSLTLAVSFVDPGWGEGDGA